MARLTAASVPAQAEAHGLAALTRNEPERALFADRAAQAGARAGSMDP